MARTKQTARLSQKPLTTWTRFYLPLEQEWPTWAVDHEDVHAGPLADVKGCLMISLGRMVDNPEQAAYIIQWYTLEDLTNFQSSPACIEFLRNLPEHAPDSPQDSIESVSELKHLTLGGDSSAPPERSRFLVLNHATEIATSEAWGLVTLTAFLVPYQVDDKFEMWQDKFKKPFCVFAPRGSEFVTGHRNFRYMSSYVWYWVRGEDHWMEEKFGKPEQQVQQDNEGRTIFCHFFLWSPYRATPEEHETAAEGEKALAADPEARESWNRAIARVMPPATAWVQERWNIEEVPRVYPPLPDIEDLEYEKTEQRLWDEFFHRSKPDERS